MELWMWIIAGGLAFGAFFWGMFMGRSTGDDSETRARNKALETELKTVKDDFGKYREDVTTHFRTTADLVHQMTNSYKAVYDHLATGSQQLCPGEVMLDLDEAPRLTSTGEGAAAKAGSSKEQETAATRGATASGTKQEQRTFH